MAYEIEIKARVNENELDDVKAALMAIPGAKALGESDKFDIYWSQTEDGEPLFRTRREQLKGADRVLFTAKPFKNKYTNGTEENQELEFTAPAGQWDDILTFFSGVGLQVCRLKWKKGPGYVLEVDGYVIHAELLNVRFLGWFLEMEICPGTKEGFDFNKADAALRKVLKQVRIPEDRIEAVGYNKLLKAVGKDRG